MKKYYMSTTKEVIELMGTNINKGLLEYDCHLRREKFGNNEIDLPFDGGNKEIVKKVLKQIHTLVALVSAGVFLYSGLIDLFFITIFLVLANISIKVIHELKKKKDLDILYNLNTATVTVIREGVQRIIPAIELVRGDVVVVKKGSFIGADMRVIEANNLKVDEKNITGEEFLKEKYDTKIYNVVRNIGEINNMLFRGTLVREGTGLAVVVETGVSTQLGKLLSNFVYSNGKKHTLYEKIEKKYSKVFICLILIAIILYLILPGSKSMKNVIFLYSIFTVLAISLPFITMIYSKKLVKSTLKENMEIRNLSSIDIVNNIKIIFLDKYGSITENKLKVSDLYTNEEFISAKDSNINDVNIKRMIDISLLTNNSKYGSNSNWEKGDMYEIAYAEFGVDKRVFKSVIDGGNIRKFEIPFNSDKNITTTLNRSKKGYRANSRGALDEILERCSYILINGVEREINKKDIENIKLADLRFSKQGLITEAFSYRSFNYQPSQSENIESHMVFVGLIAHENPIIDGVQEELKDVAKNSVLPIIFTDDNKISAEVLGYKLGLIKDVDQVTSEGELKLLTEQEALSKISKTRIFCRVSPEYKSKIISLFKNDGFNIITEGEVLGDLPILGFGDIALTKGKATTLLKNISDLYSNNSIFQVYLFLKDKYSQVMSLVNSTIKIFILFILTQIILLNSYYLVYDDIIFSSYYLIINNILLLTPILLLNMLLEVEIKSQKRVFYEYILFIAVAISIIFTMKDIRTLAVYLVLGINLITHILVNSSVSLKKFKDAKKVLLYFVLIFILGCGIIYFITNPIIDSLMIIKMLITCSIYLISEILLKKWQE